MANTRGKCQFSELRHKQMTQDHAVNFKPEVKCRPACLRIPCCYHLGLLLPVLKIQSILSCSGIQQGAFLFFNASQVSTLLFVQRKLIFFPSVRYLLKVTYRCNRCQLKKYTWPKSWELGALFTEIWSHHVVLSLTFWLNYSASFLHWISSLSYPHSITLYILN